MRCSPETVKANTTPRDVVDVDDAAADPAFTGNFIRSGQAGLFAVKTAKVEQNGEGMLAAASNRYGMPAVTKLFPQQYV